MRIKNNIAVLGSINIDIVTKVSHIPKINEVVLSEKLQLIPGGKATNAAIGLSRLEEKVWMLGKIGNDYFGKNLKDVFIKEKIETEFINIDKFVPTGTVLVTIDNNGKNTIIVNEGANIKINQQTILDFFIRVDNNKIKIDCFYTTLEPLPEIVQFAIKECSKRNIMVFCDAAPLTRPLNPDYYSLVDILSCNELEAETMTGIKIIDQQSAKNAVTKLREKGAKTIILTLGEKGSVLLTDEYSYFPGLKVKVIDETGAGDAFRTGFITEYLETKDFHKSMKMGNRMAAFTVTKLGVYDTLPTRNELTFFKTF